jgi:LacI family gluconate utilization system Gnt-I transcriptional repressor
MTGAMLSRSPDIDFLYYSNDMIGAGGLLYCLEKGFDVPGRLGLAGFNGVELLEGLPRRLATMDACRREIGRKAAEIVAAQSGKTSAAGELVELQPVIQFGDTIRKP